MATNWKVMSHIGRIVAEQGISVILTTIIQPCVAVCVAGDGVGSGKTLSLGAPATVITEAYLSQTYGVETEIHDITRRNGLASGCAFRSAPNEYGPAALHLTAQTVRSGKRRILREWIA